MARVARAAAAERRPAGAAAADLALTALRLTRAAALILGATEPAAADVGAWLLPELDRRLSLLSRASPAEGATEAP